MGDEQRHVRRAENHSSAHRALLAGCLGGGVIGVVVVPIGVAVVLFLLRRRWAALYFLAASVAGAALVQVITGLVGRPRPLDILVTADFGSFPSGHSANAAVIVWAPFAAKLQHENHLPRAATPVAR